MSKYTLTITEKQANIIRNALDSYSRFHMLQFGVPLNDILVWATRSNTDWEGNEIDVQSVHAFIEGVERLKQEFFKIPPNGSHGIHSPNISDLARQAYDIQQVIRHRLANDRPKDKKGFKHGVDFDTPSITSNEGCALPTIEKEE